MWKLVGAFNQKKALVGAFSMILQLCRLIVNSTSPEHTPTQTTLQSIADPTMMIPELKLQNVEDC